MKRTTCHITWGIKSLHDFGYNKIHSRIFDNVNRIIPVTIFMMMLYNACFTYQKDKTNNLLISALDGFDSVSSIDDYAFMNAFSELPRTLHIFNFE